MLLLCFDVFLLSCIFEPINANYFEDALHDIYKNDTFVDLWFLSFRLQAGLERSSVERIKKRYPQLLNVMKKVGFKFFEGDITERKLILEMFEEIKDCDKNVGQKRAADAMRTYYNYKYSWKMAKKLNNKFTHSNVSLVDRIYSTLLDYLNTTKWLQPGVPLQTKVKYAMPNEQENLKNSQDAAQDICRKRSNVNRNETAATPPFVPDYYGDTYYDFEHADDVKASQASFPQLSFIFLSFIAFIVPNILH